ncbi:MULTISPECIES: hypothetical protein [Nostocaceae]|uniref:hypothetical protein n=1 Tax=Nostocaceae TaxID=1162 RepID=UPI0016843868|nr:MULTISPECIES: hypothetical protein [Nostocaceae]MBD2479535.1 hypothetical protein [Anabaena sp. FACHB-83]
MFDPSVNISNIVLTYEQYRKLKAYGQAHHISIQESIKLIIDSHPEYQINHKKISRDYPFICSRRMIHLLFKVK